VNENVQKGAEDLAALRWI